jgi:glycosyltransferase involved in cell wall biosynthesis
MTSVFYDRQMFENYTHGGVARYFAILATRGTEAGFDPSFNIEYSCNSHYFDLGGGALRRVPPLPKVRRVTQLLNWRAARQLPRGDLWHSTHYDAMHLASVPDTMPMVATVHDMIPELSPEYFSDNPHKAKFDYVERAKVVIAVSQSTRDDLVSVYGTDPSKVIVVHHGIDTVNIRLSELKLPEPYVLFVGSRSKYKNFKTLAAAFAQFQRRRPDFSLVCIGGGPTTRAEKDQLRDLGVSKVVFRTASEEELNYAYAHASVFVYPSLYEGFGFPIIEAMANNCPCILSRASCFPEIAQDAAVYFEPLDVDGLAAALDSVVGNQALRSKLVVDGARRTLDFTLDRMVGETKAVYDLVL